MVEEVELMLGLRTDEQSATFRPVGEKLDSTRRTGKEYGLSSRNVSRYLRINKLLPEQSRDEIEGIIAKALDMYFGR